MRRFVKKLGFLLFFGSFIDCFSVFIRPISKIPVSMSVPQEGTPCVKTLSFSKDGSLLAMNVHALAQDGRTLASEIQIWNVNEQTLLSSVAKQTTEHFFYLFWNEAGNLIAVDERTGTVKFWNATSGQLIQALSIGTNFNLIQPPILSKDFSVLALLAQQGNPSATVITLVDVSTQVIKKQMKPLRHPWMRIFLSEQGELVGALDSTNLLEVFESKNDSLTTYASLDFKKLAIGQDPQVLSMFSQRNKVYYFLVKSSSGDSTIFQLFQADTKTLVYQNQVSSSASSTYSISPDGSRVVLLSNMDEKNQDLFHQATVLDATTGVLTTTSADDFLFGQTLPYPASDRVFIVRRKKTDSGSTTLPEIWESSLGGPKTALEMNNCNFTDAIFSADGNKIAVPIGKQEESNKEVWIYFSRGI